MRKSFKKIGTTVTSTVMAAGMVLGPVSSVHAEEITAPLTANDGSETMAEVTDPATVETPAETPIETPTETPTEDPVVTPTEEPTVTPAAPNENGSGENGGGEGNTGEGTDEKNPGEVTPTPSETPETPKADPDGSSEKPSVTPEVTPETTPEVTPEATPETTPEATPETTPEASQEANDDAEQDSAAEESKDLSAWANHIDYGKYFKHAAKDIRKGFAKVDKTYAYAKVKTSLNVREGTSKDSRIIGKLSAKALCYVIADGDKDWVYIESGDVRGFVKASYLQQGKKALKYVTKTGEDKMETAEQVVKPEDNKAFTYVTNTVYDVKNGTGEGIINFADQFVGNPYVWGGDSLTNGIDCSHFVYEVLSRCGVYDGEYTTSYGWRSFGEEVKSLEDAKAGDVVCYEGHVALYDGDGDIVEAKGTKWGITHDRKVDCNEILTIRRFATTSEENGDSNAEVIQNYLLDLGFSKAGVAGIMANIANEAYPAFNPSSLEIKSINNTGVSSDQFTTMVDSGQISRNEVITSSRFGLYSGGRYGYGLCGFTDPVIKEYLCRYTIDEGKSIGSISGQLDSLIAYLEDYKPGLLESLKNATDPKTAASDFLREYENPANIEQENVERTTAAEDIFNAME